MMVFPQYARLPVELRLQIIKEAVAQQRARRRRRRISALATVDAEWNDVIERILFRNITIGNQDLQEFADICGTRNILLKRVTCKFQARFQAPEPVDSTTSAGMRIIHRISQLFRTMEDWSRADRRNKLIKVSICADVFNHSNRYVVSSESSDFPSLPKVSVIGGMYAQYGCAHDTFLSQDTMNALHERLPNLHGTQLAIPNAASTQETINDARGKCRLRPPRPPYYVHLRFANTRFTAQYLQLTQ